MTREEFIDRYMARSGIDPSLRVRGGFRMGSGELLALPCCCGIEGCEGWAMLSEANIADHMRLYGPTDATW